jgi:hypothetical protein
MVCTTIGVYRSIERWTGESIACHALPKALDARAFRALSFLCTETTIARVTRLFFSVPPADTAALSEAFDSELAVNFTGRPIEEMEHWSSISPAISNDMLNIRIGTVRTSIGRHHMRTLTQYSSLYK